MKSNIKKIQFIDSNKKKLQEIIMKYFQHNPKARRLLNKDERKKGDVQFLFKILISGLSNYYLAKKGERCYVLPSNGTIAEILECSPQWISEIAEMFSKQLGMKKQTKEQIDNPRFTKYRNDAWVVFNELLLARESKTDWSKLYFFRTKFYKEISKENAKLNFEKNNIPVTLDPDDDWINNLFF